MRFAILVTLLVSALFASAVGFAGGSAFQIREDFGEEPLAADYLNYYYFIPCPTAGWFWGWDEYNRQNDIIGAWFEIGDVSMYSGRAADSVDCNTLTWFRVLDFAAHGSLYPAGAWTVSFDVWCADEQGCPVGPPLWTSGPVELMEQGWNYVGVYPPIRLCSCAAVPGPVPSSPRILITATHLGYDPDYPAWGMDNVSLSVSHGCSMHDASCLPALYPRPYTSHYSSLHSGYYGNGAMQYCPAKGFKDQSDSTPDGTLYGYVELAWRIYLDCAGPSSVEPTTWGAVKSMYK